MSSGTDARQLFRLPIAGQVTDGEPLAGQAIGNDAAEGAERQSFRRLFYWLFASRVRRT